MSHICNNLKIVGEIYLGFLIIYNHNPLFSHAISVESIYVIVMVHSHCTALGMVQGTELVQ